MDTKTILMISPIILIQVILIVINLINISKKSKTKYLSKRLWIVIIILGNYIGNISYMVLESERNDNN